MSLMCKLPLTAPKKKEAKAAAAGPVKKVKFNSPEGQAKLEAFLVCVH